MVKPKKVASGAVVPVAVLSDSFRCVQVKVGEAVLSSVQDVPRVKFAFPSQKVVVSLIGWKNRRTTPVDPVSERRWTPIKLVWLMLGNWWKRPAPTPEAEVWRVQADEPSACGPVLA